ncbi:hypothetical protein [Bradyrhizobium sp.]|nr:hypothetical protein [Bradyrhizobium sp.]
MKNEFNRAPNDSPRSGSSKRATPLVLLTLAIVAVVIWLAIRP